MVYISLVLITEHFCYSKAIAKNVDIQILT